jgi:putative protease
MRKFNDQIIELLAPAGNFEIFRSIVESRCDAIYFGGQTLNMRLIRKGFNFSDEELRDAIKMARDRGKKSYITVNNLIDTREIDAAKAFLDRLAGMGPDGIIVQDFAVVSLVNRMKLPLEMHSSVMMNVHNLKFVEAVKREGVTRVVMSRNNTLEEIKWIRKHVDIEIEYFTHGDMCVAHGAQCYYSSMLFGMSSNRGRCLKPCRWWFSRLPNEEKDYPMAVKDMCMYQFLPEMIHAGVNSFKIEGRMREKEFITQLVNWYGDALDRYLEDPIGFDRFRNYRDIYESRKRDLSTAYAFGRANESNINSRYEGTGKFYSTGKMFSTPTAEKDLDAEDTAFLKDKLAPESPAKAEAPKISVRVNNMAQARVAVEEGADRVYIAADVLNPDAPMTLAEIRNLREYRPAGRRDRFEIYLATPRMMNETQFIIYSAGLEKMKPYIDGLLVGNLGALEAFRSEGLPMAGDYSLNIFNGMAADFYLERGLSMVAPSVELGAADLKDFCLDCRSTELVAHGRLASMYFDHDFYDIYGQDNSAVFSLFNEAGMYDIYRDQFHRTHLLTTHHFTVLPLLEEIGALGVAMLRIEAQTDESEYLRETIRAFRSGDAAALRESEILGGKRYSYEALIFRSVN